MKVCNSRREAVLLSAVLMSNGIRSSISADDVGGMEPHLNLGQGVKILVDPRHMNRTKEILSRVADNAEDLEFQAFKLKVATKGLHLLLITGGLFFVIGLWFFSQFRTHGSVSIIFGLVFVVPGAGMLNSWIYTLKLKKELTRLLGELKQ